MNGILLRDAEVDGRRADVRLRADRIVELGTGLPAARVERVVDCLGGALLPGLVDHHLHLHALASALRSVPCGPPDVRDRGALAGALRSASADEHGWVRGVGYVEDVAGPLDSAALDALYPSRPLRIQHRSGALWMLNSAAAEAVSLASADHPGVERTGDGGPTGRLWRADDWLRSRLPATGPPDLADVGERLTAYGITSVTDASPNLDTAALTAIGDAMREGALPQRVHLLGVPLGVRPPAGPATGPYKIVLADSDLPDLGELAGTVRAAHAAGRPVAVHCVSREGLVLLLTALDEAGTRAGDRIEHAALVPEELRHRLAELGLRVVTQPGFLARRGDDYLRDVPAEEHADLYRCASLLSAGVPVALSSDAPYGPLDPWTVIAAAIGRRTASGAVLGPDERVGTRTALAAYLAPAEHPGGPPRRLAPGAPADLVLLHEPLAVALDSPHETVVRHTIIAGRIVR